MTFEEGLRAELIELEEIKDKVFPLAAPKDPSAPYMVYKRGECGFGKTLSGISKIKTNGIYGLVLVTDNYAALQDISSKIVDKLISFLGREIGTEGPLIKDIDVKIMGDSYEPEIDKFICSLEVKVNY